MLETEPLWFIALALLGVTLIVLAIGFLVSKERMAALLAGVPGAAILFAAAVDAWQVVA